jgi:sigma-E factor negative regulatory protein RseB
MEFRSCQAGGMSPGTEPASLWLITTAVVVGLVMSGVAVASGWGLVATGSGARGTANGPPAQATGARPRGPAQAAGLKLLSQAAQACRSISYRGVEMAWWGPGGGDTSVVEVWHQPGGQAFTQAPGTQSLTTAPGSSMQWPGSPRHQVVSPGSSAMNLGEAGVLGVSSRLVKLLGANYVLAIAGQGQVAGRPARIVTVRRRGGTLAAWFWLDSATSLPLRKEMFDARADLVSNVTFAEVSIGRGAVSGAPAAAAARAWRTTLAPRQLAGLREHGWPLPGPLPGDLTLIGAKENITPSGPVVDLDYSDGLSVVSIFVQRGYLPDTLTGWSQVALAGHKVYARDPDDLCFAWSAGGFVYTLVAAAPRQTVGQVVVALPHDDDPGWLSRMKHGMRRLLSWFSP